MSARTARYLNTSEAYRKVIKMLICMIFAISKFDSDAVFSKGSWKPFLKSIVSVAGPCKRL